MVLFNQEITILKSLSRIIFGRRLKLALATEERVSTTIMSSARFESAISILFDKTNKTCPLKFWMTPPIPTGSRLPMAKPSTFNFQIPRGGGRD